MRFIFGDSYGDVANRELATDQARDNRLFQSLAANRALAQLINSQQQQGWENAYRQSAFAQSVRQAAEQAAEQRRQFEQARAMDAFKTMLQNSLSERGLNLSEREVAAKEGQTDYNEATNAVQQGLLENDQIAKSFPSLSPLRLDRLQQYRNALAAREGEDVTANEGAAKSLNALLTLQRQAKAISDLGSRPSWDWLWKDTQGDWDKAKGTILKGQIPETTQLEPSMLSTWVAERLKSPAYRDRAMWDEEAQRFLPIARPRIFTRNALPAAVPPAAPSGGPFAAGSNMGAFLPFLMQSASQPAQFNSEAEARAAGYRSGDIVLALNPRTGRYERARLK